MPRRTRSCSKRLRSRILLPDVAANSGATARFINEARAAARIRGENVAAVTDVGSLDDGTAFMVLEYLEGEDLEDYAMREGPLPPELAVDFVLQALQALAQAHTQGFVHRDIKPSNLFLSRRHDGATIVKVLDFGISKAPRLNESTEGHATSTRTVLGSPYYMAPEQARSARSVDPRADQWAVGVTLYRLLTGELPFGGETLTELLLEIVEATPLRPRSYRPELPEGLEGVVLRCLKKDRAERFANVAELAQALQPFAGADGAANAARISRTMGVARAPLASLSAIGAPRAATPVVAPSPAEAVTNEPDLTSAVASTPRAHELRPAGYEATAALPRAANDTALLAGVGNGTAGGKPPSSGGATAPTMPAPPMPPGASALGGTPASAGVGTHAGWAEASVDSQGAGVRSPRLVLAGVAALAMVAGIAIVLASSRGAHPAPATTEAPAKTADSTAASASSAASTSGIDGPTGARHCVGRAGRRRDGGDTPAGGHAPSCDAPIRGATVCRRSLRSSHARGRAASRTLGEGLAAGRERAHDFGALAPGRARTRHVRCPQSTQLGSAEAPCRCSRRSPRRRSR